MKPDMDARQFQRVVAAREFINGNARNENDARVMELMAFMELFEGRKITEPEARKALGIER